MKRWLRFRNWSVRAKLAALLTAASVLPLALSAYLDVQSIRQSRVRDAHELLGARAEQLAREIDGIQLGYLRGTQRVALQPALQDYCSAPPADRPRLAARVQGLFGAFPRTDPGVRGMALIDADGRVEIATDAPIVGMNFSSRVTVRAALKGAPMISDMYVSTVTGLELPTVAFFAPVTDSFAQVRCVVATWVNAEALWQVLRNANAKAGAGSFAVLYDAEGIRIGHSYRQDIVFRPAAPLEPALRQQLVATRRFGPRTQALLDNVLPFPEQFERARSIAPSAEVFRGYARITESWNYGVAARLHSAPWTVFYMMPEANLTADLDLATRGKIILALCLITAAGLVGAGFAASILHPVHVLGQATSRLAAGQLDTRVPQTSTDELGQLGARFNTMAIQLQAQAMELRKSHHALRRYADELEAANKDLEAFAFSVSHDLRAPLHVIQGFSQILATRHAGQMDDKALHYLARIRASVTQMEQLVEGILRLSRLARRPLERQPVDVDRLVAEVLEQARTEGVVTTHAVTVQPGLGTALADQVLLRQVFANLLSNACKFAGKQAQPQVSISAAAGTGCERVYTVRDNGTGFDPVHAGQLFQPFRRLHLADDYPGLGIGLSIVQRIVQRHGGRVWAESAEGEGASFHFTLGPGTSVTAEPPATPATEERHNPPAADR
jgi:signal transduction histidine kinase